MHTDYSDIDDLNIQLPPEPVNTEEDNVLVDDDIVNVEVDIGNDNVLVVDDIGNLNVDEQSNDGEGEVRQSRYGRTLRPPTHLADYDTV